MGAVTDQRQQDEGFDHARRRIVSIGHHAQSVNRARAAELRQAVLLAAQGQLDDDRRAAAARVAHQLTGSAGTFGYRRASRLAAQLEQLLRTGDHSPAAHSEARRVALALVVELDGEPSAPEV